MDPDKKNEEKIPSPALEEERDILTEKATYAGWEHDQYRTKLVSLILSPEPHDELQLRRLAATIERAQSGYETLIKRLMYIEKNWNEAAKDLERRSRAIKGPPFEDDIPF